MGTHIRATERDLRWGFTQC